MMRKVAALSIVTLLGATAPQAGDFEVPITAEVLTGWVTAKGERIAGLRMTLAPGWKTYWRAPGDAGIPPSFDWTGSGNLGSVAVEWPAPTVFDQNGLRSIGYEGAVILPLRISPREVGEPVTLDATVEIGICADVCIPHALQIAAELADSETAVTPAIAAALAARPFSAGEAGVKSAVCTLTPTSDGLTLEARIDMPPSGSPEHVVIEPAAANVWVSEAETRRRGSQLIASAEMVNVTGGPIALDRSAVRITVLGADHAVDIHGCSAN